MQVKTISHTHKWYPQLKKDWGKSNFAEVYYHYHAYICMLKKLRIRIKKQVERGKGIIEGWV